MLGILSHGPEFQQPTPEARREAFKAAAVELTRRGLDAVALVRYGMSREATAPHARRSHHQAGPRVRSLNQDGKG